MGNEGNGAAGGDTVGPGEYRIISVTSNKSVSPGPSGLCLRDTRIDDQQKFTITPIEKGDAIIHEIECSGGTVWNVAGGSREPGGVIINYTSTGGDNERFVFRHRDGKYAIQCVESLLCISVRGHPNDGALIIQSKKEDKELFYVQEWLDLIRKEQEKARAAAKQALLDKLSAQQQQIQQQLKDQNRRDQRRDQRQHRQKALQRADQKRADAEYQALQSETGVLVKARDSTLYRSSKALEKNRKKERHHWEDAGPTDSREQPKQNAEQKEDGEVLAEPRPRTSIDCLMR